MKNTYLSQIIRLIVASIPVVIGYHLLGFTGKQFLGLWLFLLGNNIGLMEFDEIYKD